MMLRTTLLYLSGEPFYAHVGRQDCKWLFSLKQTLICPLSIKRMPQRHSALSVTSPIPGEVGVLLPTLSSIT